MKAYGYKNKAYGTELLLNCLICENKFLFKIHLRNKKYFLEQNRKTFHRILT
jgi:hypothetical protein